MRVVVVGKIILMMSNYFHDLSVALLATNVIAVYYVGRYLDKHPSKDAIVAVLFQKLSRITYGAFIYVLLAGAVRAYYFQEFEWNPAVGRGQTVALILKHIILFSVTGFGIVVHRRYQKRYGKVRP